MAEDTRLETDASQLVAAIAQRTVDDLHFTTDSIIAGKDREILELRQVLNEVLTELALIPDAVRSVKIDRLVRRYSYYTADDD